MKNTDTGDLALIVAFVLLPIVMVNALFVFVISLLGGNLVLYTLLVIIDATIITYILMRTEIGLVVRSHIVGERH